MKNIILGLFFTLSLVVNAQNKPYTTQKQNLAWLDSLKNIQSKRVKLDFIKAKIYSDTLYRKVIIMDNPRDPERHICQTLFVICHLDKYYRFDLRDNQNLSSIMKYINEKNISEIKILEHPDNVILYGNEGLCGVVTIYCNKKIERKLRNVIHDRADLQND